MKNLNLKLGLFIGALLVIMMNGGGTEVNAAVSPTPCCPLYYDGTSSCPTEETCLQQGTGCYWNKSKQACFVVTLLEPNLEDGFYCTGSITTGAEQWPGAQLGLTETKPWHYSTSQDQCGYKCKENYQRDGYAACNATCVGDLEALHGEPADANSTNPGDEPKSWTLDVDGDGGACEYKCKSGYEPQLGNYTCVPKQKGKRFEPRKTTSTSSYRKLPDKKLTETGWNDLMDELNNIDGLIEELLQFKLEQLAINQYYVPAGAIMAFNLTGCPDGWSRFDVAEGRLLRGANSAIGTTGGGGNVNLVTENKSVLTVGQLPAHHHYMFGAKNTNTANTYGLQSLETSQNQSPNFKYDNRFVAVQSKNTDNYFYYMGSRVLGTGYKDNNEKYVRNGLTSSLLVDTKGDPYYSQDYFDFTNAYVKVLYCVKD